MIRGLLLVLGFAAVLFFPWPVAAIIGLTLALREPLAPLSLGIFADTLYWSPAAHALPVFTIAGALACAASYLVRGRLSKGIIGE
jgi:hypothetical protein